MFGRAVFSTGTYCEYLLAEQNSVWLIACVQGRETKLYRIEWIEYGYQAHNKAVYSLPEAIQAFYGKVRGET